MPAQRAARKAVASKPYTIPKNLSSDTEATPSLSTASDHDRSSDFAPEPETPVKEEELMGEGEGEGEGEEQAEAEDSKPDIGEDEYLFSEDEGYGRKPKKGKKKANGQKESGSPTKGRGGEGGGSPKKLGQAWTGDENWALFQQIHPKVSKPDWKGIAQAVGRDAKACQNRYALLGKRLEAVVKGMSGK